VLSDEVSGFPSPPPWIYRSGGATLPKPRVVCNNYRRLHPPLTSRPHHTKTAGRTCVRDHYSVATEGPRRLITFVPPRRPLRTRQHRLKRRARRA
jgi:hypothetical protein